jgi:hypothetical protein
LDVSPHADIRFVAVAVKTFFLRERYAAAS